MAAAYQSAHDVSAALEAGEALREAMRPNGSERTAGQRLGTVLASKNVKIGDVVTSWDKDGDGTIDAAEFSQRVLQLGLIVDRPSDVQDLFASLDDDHSGVLDLSELKEVLASDCL